MSENIAAKHQRQFLITWSGLNFLGWIIGILLVMLIQSSLEEVYRFYALRTFLIWLPLGAGIGIFQWSRLRLIGINGPIWVLITALGGSMFITLFSWIANFHSFEYRAYNIPNWVINTCAALAVPIGGAIIGGLQSLVLSKYISRLGLWVSAYVFGLSLLAISGTLGILFKSFLLNLLYFLLDPLHSFEIWVFLVEMRWMLFFAFLLTITALCISLLTGKVLIDQPNKNLVTIRTG